MQCIPYSCISEHLLLVSSTGHQLEHPATSVLPMSPTRLATGLSTARIWPPHATREHLCPNDLLRCLQDLRSTCAAGNHAAAAVGAGYAVARTRDVFVRPLLWLAVFNVSGSSMCFTEDPMCSTQNQVVSEPCKSGRAQWCLFRFFSRSRRWRNGGGGRVLWIGDIKL